MRETAKDKGRLQHILSSIKFIGKLWFVFGMWLVFSTFDI